jgi:polygalacturonase
MVIDGVYIRSSLKEAVWADGIDPDGCKDLRISNCTIETGDDALVFYSMNWFGPALPGENITVTNCRLSSASSAIKFCDGNMN